MRGSSMEALRTYITRKGGDGKEGAYVAIKFEVQPHLHDKFIKNWQKVNDEVQDEEGNTIYTLSKTRGDNLFFWLYGEWEDMEDFYDHFTSKYVEDWVDFLDENDIEFHMFPLKKVTKDVMNEDLEKRRHRRDEDEEDMDIRDAPAHVLIQYHVPPSMTEDFIDMWDEVAKATEGEKDNAVYALRKVATMNHHFLVYGTWESFDAYLDHFESKHIRKLRDFAADNDIEWYVEPLQKFGEDKETDE